MVWENSVDLLHLILNNYWDIYIDSDIVENLKTSINFCQNLQNSFHDFNKLKQFFQLSYSLAHFELHFQSIFKLSSHFHWHSNSTCHVHAWFTQEILKQKNKRILHTYYLISSVILRLFSLISSVSYSAHTVWTSKRSAFFFVSAVVVCESAADGSLIMGIVAGTLQFKVIKAAMPDDFLLIPIFPSFSLFEVMIRLFSRFNLVNIQCWKDDMRRWINRGRIKRRQRWGWGSQEMQISLRHVISSFMIWWKLLTRENS